MTETIQAALSPLLIVGSFCSLSFFEYPLGRPRPYLTSLYFLITWSFYVYIFYYLVYTNEQDLAWTDTVIIFCEIASMFISLFRYKKLKSCLCKLSVVDDTLEMLGTLKEYRRLYKWTIRTTIGWILLYLVINWCDILWNYQEFSISDIYLPFIQNHMLHVNALNGLIWAAILRYISTRFHQINEHIRDLLKDNAMCTRRRNKLILCIPRSTEEPIKCRQYMWIIMHIHLELCFISRELNEVFSIQMTLEMASYFTFFVESCCKIYGIYLDNDKDTTFQEYFDDIDIYVWIIVYTVKLLALNHICQIICDKANETVAILYELSNNHSDKDFREQILQFILQIKRREIKFYGMGLFYFGYDLIRKFYMTAATLLVIIIQMDIDFENYIISYDDDDDDDDVTDEN